MKGISRFFLGFLFIGLALFLVVASLIPLRLILNIFPFNFPFQDKRIPVFSCELDKEITIYLYYSHGSHATTSDGNSIYAQFRSQPFERMIWSASSSPWIVDIYCQAGVLTVVTSSNDLNLKEFNITSNEIENSLIKKPIRIYKGKISNEPISDSIDWICFSVFIFPGILFLVTAIFISTRKNKGI